MNTRFGGRQRPQFKILRWITFESEGAMLPAAASASLPSPSQPGQAKPETGAKAGGARTVEAPTLREELNDDLPFN